MKIPAYEAQYGKIKVTAWKNNGENGPWYSFQVSRSYKDNKDQWHHAQTFGCDDLLVVAEALSLALVHPTKTPDFLRITFDYLKMLFRYSFKPRKGS